MSIKKRVGRIQLDNETANRMLDQVTESIDGVLTSPILNGRVLEVSVKAGRNVITTGIPALTGWMVIGKNKSGDVWESGQGGRGQLILTTSFEGSLKLWVF